MACKQVCSYSIKLISFTCTDLSPKKVCEATKEKKDVVSNWSLTFFFGKTPLVAASKSLKMQILILPFEGKIESSTGL